MRKHAVAALQVADEDFLVASLIERCPKTMMLRELMRNAIEAASLAAPDQRFIEISAQPFDGVSKLAIWNTGPGMDATELLEMSNIASSIGKEKSLTGNFGMGAKVASLPSNQRGIRYRSCKMGRIHEVILCKRDGVYGRLLRHDHDTDEYVEVIDVTDIAVAEGRPITQDWTEVVLFGNQPDQDTVRNPYNGDPLQDSQWLATYLYHRFYRLPDAVKVTLLRGTNKLDGNRQFLPIPARLSLFERHETVEVPGGIKIHYLYDGPYDKGRTGHNKSVSGAIASDVSTCAIIYRDELYDVRKGRTWSFDAPIFGIPFGAKHISVHIELPANYAVVPDGYRQFLRRSQGEQPHVSAHDFAELVRDHRPDWLIDIIRTFAPDSASSDDIRNELQKLLNQLRVRRISPRVVIQGQTKVSPGTGAASDCANGSLNGGVGDHIGRQRPTDLTIIPTGAKRAIMFKNLERAPEIIPLSDDAEIEEKGLKGRAARFVMEAGQLFVNMQYSAIGEMRAQLEKEYADAADPETMRSLAKQHAERTMILRVGRTVVYALAKQLNTEWDRRALEIASSPESLSMAADDFTDALQNVRRDIGRKLRTNRAIGQSNEPGLAALVN